MIAPKIDLIMPALNEAQAIGRVIRAIPRPPIRTIIVADNASHDGTAERARDAGAQVVREERRGYGSACLAALEILQSDCEIVVFMDADGSDEPAKIPEIVAPIIDDRADIVIGTRALGVVESGALSLPQRVGNLIASRWLRLRFQQPATDLGPLRAIRRDVLDDLNMRDPDYGWTVEMQIKAARRGCRYVEIPVPYYRRSGKSKVSGTVRGTIGASVKILGWLAYYDLRTSIDDWRNHRQ